MNVHDLARLFAYVADLRHRFLATFRDIGWEATLASRGATSDSLRDLLVHVLEVEDSYLHYDIRGEPWPHGERPPQAFDSFDALEACDQEVAQKARQFFASLQEEDLRREVEIEGWDLLATVEAVLLHTFLDEIAHLGEMVALLWQIDVEPPWQSIVRLWTGQT